MAQSLPRRRSYFQEPARTSRERNSSNGSRASSLLLHVTLFVLTLASVFAAGAMYVRNEDLTSVIGLFFSGVVALVREGSTDGLRAAAAGWVFAVPLMSILLAHEFGHYTAARIHRVPASLPFFIPMPISPLGTMGAVIAMRGRIPTRRALLDIGASGPIAGMVVAVPVLVWGLLHSEVKLVTGHGMQEGQCLLYLLLKRLTVGTIPEGHDVFLNATAFAGWTGLFVTMINLLPVAQLDGGHVAYALLGPLQDRVTRWVHRGLLLLFVGSVAFDMARSGPDGGAGGWAGAISNSMFWLVWFGLLAILMRLGGAKHPPTEDGSLGPVRKVVAVACLVLFALLFMPTPLAAY